MDVREFVHNYINRNVLITEDLHKSWIFQDAEKFKWWVDLHFMADENGVINMSLNDLSHRWNADKSTISRFFKKLSGATLGATIMQHQMQRIIRIKQFPHSFPCSAFSIIKSQHRN